MTALGLLRLYFRRWSARFLHFRHLSCGCRRSWTDARLRSPWQRSPTNPVYIFSNVSLIEDADMGGPQAGSSTIGGESCSPNM